MKAIYLSPLLFLLLSFTPGPLRMGPPEGPGPGEAVLTGEKKEGLREKEFKYVFYPLGVGQYQNGHFLKAKFFMLAESSAFGAFLISPLFDGGFTGSVGKYSLFGMGGLYLLSVIDGLIFFRPGSSPVQPYFSGDTTGFIFSYSF